MADGSTLAVVLDLVKGYIGASQSAGSADDLMLKTLIERKQLFFTTRYSWSKLEDRWDLDLSAPNLRFVTLPVTDYLAVAQIINFRRPYLMQLFWANTWHTIRYGIGSAEYNFRNSEAVPPMVQDPIQAWMRKAGDSTKIEVWPVTAGAPQNMRLTGQRVVGTLRSAGVLDSTKLVELDDDMVSLAVASDWLIRKKDQSAVAIRELAESTFNTIRGDDPTATESFRVGAASDTDTGKIKRVVSLTVTTA